VCFPAHGIRHGLVRDVGVDLLVAVTVSAIAVVGRGIRVRGALR
jgi:hypothetical protein